MPRSFKVSLIGDPRVGKTSIALRHVQGSFPTEHSPTLGTNFHVWNTIINGEEVKLLIADTGSQEKFLKVLPTYFKNSTAVALIFDVTNKESFEHIHFWHKLVMESIGNVPCILVGNKIDLEMQRVVKKEEAKQLSIELGAKYFEVSAKTKENLEQMFKELAKLAITTITLT